MSSWARADKERIDYRHIIHSLVRKPGAFRRYRFREALFPRLEFRRAYDALVSENDARADLEYVRILHLAASDAEQAVQSVIAELLSRDVLPTYEAVRECVRGPLPDVVIAAPDLSWRRSGTMFEPARLPELRLSWVALSYVHEIKRYCRSTSGQSASPLDQ